MSPRKRYNIVYAILMAIIIVLFLVPLQNDMVDMLLGIFAVILTSVFTYTNRHDIPRKRRQEDHS